MSLDDLTPELREYVARTEAAIPSQKTPEFTRLQENLVSMQACTSLSDEEATARANLLPPGDHFRWTPIADRTPVPCDDNPSTHRHIVFEC